MIDLVLYNGKIYTMNADDDTVDAIAIDGGRIIACGSARDILPAFDPVRKIDLDRRAVIPGLIDAHGHLLWLGLSLNGISLRGIDNYTSLMKTIHEAVNNASPGEWIIGRGWDQNLWHGREFPARHHLDVITPNNPVYLVRVDGHAACVNTVALDQAKITEETPDPPGGRIIRDEEGVPTGVLLDSAMDLVAQKLPHPTSRQQSEALQRAISECVSYGITTVHDMGMNMKTIDIYRDIIDQGDAIFRLYVAIDGVGETWDSFLHRGKIVGERGDTLTVRSIKVYCDGALGSRGAALFDAYSDDLGNYGLLLKDEDEIHEIALTALDHGFQVCTHAIGDRATRVVLNAYERAFREKPSYDHRFRIEHAQVVHQDDFPRFKSLGVIPSMQPVHCTSDMPWAADRLGMHRMKGAYAWRSFLDQGVIIAGGSDFPVEPVNPLLGIVAAETRQDQSRNPTEGWFPEQRITRQEAFRMFTTWAAYAAFEEHIKGSLEPGKLADLVIYPVDIMEIDAAELFDVRPDMTILAGQIVYSSSRQFERSL